MYGHAKRRNMMRMIMLMLFMLFGGLVPLVAHADDAKPRLGKLIATTPWRNDLKAEVYRNFNSYDPLTFIISKKNKDNSWKVIYREKIDEDYSVEGLFQYIDSTNHLFFLHGVPEMTVSVYNYVDGSVVHLLAQGSENFPEIFHDKNGNQYIRTPDGIFKWDSLKEKYELKKILNQN